MNENIKLACVGDIMLGEETSVGFGIRSSSEKYGYDFPFKYIKEALTDNDFVFGNLEVPLTDINLNKDSLQLVRFRGSPNFAPVLKQMGFRILSIANNHSMQFGKDGLYDCIKHLNKNDIRCVGLQSENNRTKMETIKVNNQQIGFIAYSIQPSEEYRNESNIVSFVKDNTDLIIREVKTYSKNVNHLFVSLHWGHEFVNHPSDTQIQLAHSIINAGARGVIGHHPHVLQGIEIYNSGIIAYSLGNFIFDQHFPACLKSAILELGLDESKIVYHKIIPVKSNNNFQPELPSASDAIEIKSEIKKFSDRITNKIDNTKCTSLDCYLEEMKLKAEFQKLQNIYFLKNIYKIRLRFIFHYIIKKISNLVMRRSYYFKYNSLKNNLIYPPSKIEH